MNDLDNWLNSLGFDNNSSSQESFEVPTSSAIASSVPSTETEPQPQTESPITNISPDDFNDILAENGFQEPVYEEAEEVAEEDEEEEEYNENMGEGRDLDAEEDAAMEAFNAVEEQTTATPPAPEPPIPYNSPTLLLNNATSRFSGTEWYNEIQKQRIIIAGIGGIGSNCVYQLARMNPAALFMYDDDIVEQANMSGQLYCQDNIGKAKVDAMADMIKSYTTMRNIYAIKDKFKADSEAGDVMICGFDNMEARRIFFMAWNNHVMAKPEEERKKCLYLDGRLSINTLQVFCITGDNDWAMAEYADKYLFTDAEAEETQCSLKQTTYLACMIGSFIVNLFTNWTANLLNPIIPYDLPFFTEYDAQNMIFKTIK